MAKFSYILRSYTSIKDKNDKKKKKKKKKNK